MQLFGLACVTAYSATALLVAVRLLRLALRSGRPPELLIGCALLMGGALGYPFTVASGVTAQAAPELAQRLAVGGTLALFLSAWTMLLAWRTIYHPGLVWSLAVVVASTVLLGLFVVDRLAVVDPTAVAGRSRVTDPGYRLSLVVQMLPYVLNAASGLRYGTMLRRRIRIGLADPVVANRILLWSLSSLLVATQYGWGVAMAPLARWLDVVAVSPALVGILGLVNATLLTFAFFPPRAYERWIGARPPSQRA